MEPRQEVFDANDNAAFWVVALTVSFVGYVLLLPLLLFLQQSSTNSSKCEEEAFVGTTNSSDSSSNCNSSSANTASEIRTKEEASHSTSTTAAQPGTQYADADLDLEMHLREGKEDDGAASSSCVQTCNFWQRMLQSCRPRRNASSRWYKHKESIHNLILKIAIKQEGEQMEKREEKTLLLDNAEKKDTIFTWDYETRQTTKIILHSTIAPFLEGGMNIVLLIILGIWVGTNNLTVYLLVNRFIGFTTEALYGTLQRTLYKLTTDLKSNSTNINNHDETGQFAQITFILILALSIPMWILWVLCIEPFLQWLGMNDDVVSMGADYTILFMLMSLIQAINDCLYYMIAKRNPTGSYVTYCLLLEKTLMVLILTTWIASAEDVDLITVGLIQLEVVIAFLVINVAVTTCKGWLKTYQKGLMGGWAIAVSVIKDGSVAVIMTLLYSAIMFLLFILGRKSIESGLRNSIANSCRKCFDWR